MRRSNFLALGLLLSLALVSTGCVTRTSRDWGYVDNAAPVVAANTTYVPQVTPSAIPSGNVAVAPRAQAVQVQPTYTAVAPTTRQSYEHNHESFNLNDIAPWAFMAIMGTEMILHHSHGKNWYRGHRGYRGWGRW